MTTSEPQATGFIGETQKLVASKYFQNFITAVIVFAGVVVGLETSSELVERSGHVLEHLNTLILWIFVAEIIIKMVALTPRPWDYFKDPWNVFDFTIVAVCFLPFDAQYVAVLRMFRLLRVLKLVTAIPKLQVLVTGLLKSLPSIGYVAILLGMLFYVYACASVFLFGANDPLHFENLPLAMLSLFRVVTGEDWTDVMYIQMYGCDNYGYEGLEYLCTDPVAYPVFGALFFVTFMLLGAMVILNLFIGVIMGGMDEARAEQLKQDLANMDMPELDVELAQLVQQVTVLQAQLTNLQGRLSKAAEDAPTEGK